MVKKSLRQFTLMATATVTLLLGNTFPGKLSLLDLPAVAPAGPALV